MTSEQDQRAIDNSLEEGMPVESALDFVIRYTPTVNKAARNAHKGSTFVDADDLAQEAWTYLLRHWQQLHNDGAEPLVYATASEAIRYYLTRERVDYAYFSGQFIYNPEIVRTALESGAWDLDPSGDWDIRLDVQEAYESLKPEQQELLHRVYTLGEKLDGNSAERKALNRAIDRMAHNLNGLVNRDSKTPLLVQLEGANA